MEEPTKQELRSDIDDIIISTIEGLDSNLQLVRKYNIQDLRASKPYAGILVNLRELSTEALRRYDESHTQESKS